MAAVLLVDDDVDFRTTIALAIRMRGHEVEECGSAADALGRVGACDLMICDVRLPDLDGFELVRRLPEPWPCDVVLMSAASDTLTERLALELGCRAFLTKPFAIAAVAELLPPPEPGPCVSQ